MRKVIAVVITNCDKPDVILIRGQLRIMIHKSRMSINYSEFMGIKLK